jgi:hypothetical protein
MLLYRYDGSKREANLMVPLVLVHLHLFTKLSQSGRILYTGCRTLMREANRPSYTSCRFEFDGWSIFVMPREQIQVKVQVRKN